MPLCVIVGGQYGSEGKGKISAYVTLREKMDICIRCGGPNSGHTFVAEDGTTKVLRQLPTGYINTNTRLLIPAGGLVDLDVLAEELERFKLDESRVGIDRNAIIIEAFDREAEAALGLQERLSSTLSGLGHAVSRRALRCENVRLAKQISPESRWLGKFLTDVSQEANTALDQDKKVLVEGTQGFGLSLYHSQHYPHVTSRDTTASGFLSEVGLSPRLVTDVIVVFRTFPIRVSGAQAGPLNDEINWETLQLESGYPYPLGEMTTVSKKLRRVARFDWDIASRAVAINRPTKLALNGLDYFDYSNLGLEDYDSVSDKAKRFIFELERRTSAPVEFLGVGPGIANIIARNSVENLTGILEQAVP